ncbi:FtsP/CotA-like multicopper oxidase with cupredoxin domain [Humibacillus xanthopallidus]|uniref:FtsP/CotA-like multicopper oxidase with cupredoxin domain n=1 Tax=Humibacillus xanthopallidus TaxID=412689 RepID=A0A543PN89_9MICO|nr:multicopper oxidase domain-containing protein [Humibacillus xanthopallidus]TQN45552.1 FtsP/CotA-like multicopper oxidase with cupredoxin domain [Humibacillus xanthopallidus]
MTYRSTLQRLALSLVGGVGLVVLGALVGPASSARAATVPIDLYASTGTMSLPGMASPVPVWGYRSSAGSVTAPGGPVITVTAGDLVQVTLHNALPEPTALLFTGQPMPPDRTGAAAGTTKTYSFTAGRPGTYLYEAGLVPNGQHQGAMGLHGALVVRPATPGQAYDASTAFDTEQVLVLSEIDTALNTRPSPDTFDMRQFNPRYFLVNGKVHPNTDAVTATSGQKVLLRYVNAGNQYHSMAVLGADQLVVGIDGNKVPFARRYVAETFGPGQTTDAIVTAPTTTTNRRLPIYDASMTLHNSNTAGVGGMLTFLTVSGSGTPTDTMGPVARPVAFAAGTLTATLDETTTGGAAVQSAEYYLDSVAASATPMTLSGAASPTRTASAPATVPSGSHVLYVRGRDALGNWGPFGSVLVNGGDTTGPSTTSATLTPALTNTAAGSTVAVHATADDTASGGSAISLGEYFIDTPATDANRGAGVPMTANVAAPTASLDAVIPTSALTPLTGGTHTVSIRGRDAAGNWGTVTTATLTVDRTAPAVHGLTVAPSPNNGTLSYNVGISAVRLTAGSITDTGSTVAAAEAFIDAVGANGTGIPVVALDGLYNSASEAAYANIPLSTVTALSTGSHVISVHAKDAAGNWGAVATTTLVVDKVAPTVTGQAVTPNPTGTATSVTLTATGNDANTVVTAAEWYRGADPGAGNATAMTVTPGTGSRPLTATIAVQTWNEGSYPLFVRARDAAGNWSTPVSVTLLVRGPVTFSTLGNSLPPGAGGTADDADLYTWSGTAYTRTFDASAVTAPLPAGANVDGFSRVDATHFYLSFTDAVVVPGLGTVQDEDVVYRNGTSWQLWFDGSAHGLGTSANLDLDAISVTGSTLSFSTTGNTNPPGVGGTADDADVYTWNGASFARVWDASANGIPAAANLDGFKRVDATSFYASFAADTTVPVLGAVQDEDVVRSSAGTWSVYFDGTAHGLTSANLDLDAFDVP